MTLLRKPRFFWVYPLAIWIFLAANTSEFSLRLGAALVLLGEALRLWANGYVGHVKVNCTQKWRNEPKMGSLITGGPYAYVRHPLYLGTFLIGLGVCVTVRNIFAALGALLLFALLYRKKAQGEEQIIVEEWGKAYQAYQEQVPRWLPTFRRYSHPHGEWSWEGIRASKELKTLIWVIVCLVALYFREEFWQEHHPLGGEHWVKHLALAILLITLVAIDGVVELQKRFSRRRLTRARP